MHANQTIGTINGDYPHLTAHGKTMQNKKVSPDYTCNEYREEMILAGLRKQLCRTDLSDKEREALEQEVIRREKAMGF